MSNGRDYWVRVLVTFPTPKLVEDESNVVLAGGYYRNYGITADSLHTVKDILTKDITDGDIDWPGTLVNTIDEVRLDEDIGRQRVKSRGEAIWYRSGRVLYETDTQ